MDKANNNDGHTPVKRLLSLDALRGFDMFWIVGGGWFIQALARSFPYDWINTLAAQTHHVDWEGVHCEDLIFPLFMFISGVAIPYAITSKVEKGANRNQLFRKIVKRGIILVLLGLVYNGALQTGFVNMRVASVLGQIGLGYLFAATIVLYTKSTKTRFFWLLGIMAFIATLQLAVPVPGYGAGLLDPVGGINAWIDRMFLPGRLHGGTFDPEGLLCIVSAITVTLMGSFAGSFLRDGLPASQRKSGMLALIGAVLVIVALLLSTFYPIIKAAWTVPFNLLTSGISLLLLALFYLIIDVWGWVKWSFFFRVIGMNSIFIYLFSSMGDISRTTKYLFGWIATPLGPLDGNLVLLAGGILLNWLLLYYMYKKSIFLRV